jgi:hypothetical protein
MHSADLLTFIQSRASACSGSAETLKATSSSSPVSYWAVGSFRPASPACLWEICLNRSLIFSFTLASGAPALNLLVLLGTGPWRPTLQSSGGCWTWSLHTHTERSCCRSLLTTTAINGTRHAPCSTQPDRHHALRQGPAGLVAVQVLCCKMRTTGGLRRSACVRGALLRPSRPPVVLKRASRSTGSQRSPRTHISERALLLTLPRPRAPTAASPGAAALLVCCSRIRLKEGLIEPSAE